MSNFAKTRPLMWIALLIMTALPLAAWPATYNVTASATSGTRDVSGPSAGDSYTGVISSPFVIAVSNVSDTASSPNTQSAFGAADANAMAKAGPGMLFGTVSNSARILNPPLSVPQSAAASASIDAHTTDSFVITCQHPVVCANGGRGSATVAVRVDAGSFGNGQMNILDGFPSNGYWLANAKWAASISLIASDPGPTGPYAGFASWSGGQTVSDDSNAGYSIGDYNVGFPLANPGIQTLTFEFVFGAPIQLDMILRADANASAGFDTAGSSTLTDSGSGQASTIWAGIRSITGVGGAPLIGPRGETLQGLSAASTTISGIDYVQSQVTVPEPEAALMTWSGLAFVFGLSRRRNRFDAGVAAEPARRPRGRRRAASSPARARPRT